jgi:CRISPR/Cas system-associated exonuclease Cas4 (RecB family)
MRPAIYISPSQIETFRVCPRKWAFAKIDRIPQPQSPAAAFGEACHKYREDWLNFGTPPPSDDKAGKTALAGLEHLPPPGIADVEVKLDMQHTLDNGKLLAVTGRVDFFVENQTEEKLFGELGIPLVGDHKTSSDEKWVKTPEKLKGGDAQAAIYGAWALAKTNAQAVDLHWSYMIKAASPRQLQIKTRMTIAEIAEQYGKVVEDAKKMIVFREGNIPAKEVEPNARGCDAFGGCPYREICPITNEQKIGGYMAQGSLNDMLKNLRPTETQAAPAPTSAIASAVLNPPANTPALFAEKPAAPAPAAPAPAAGPSIATLLGKVAATSDVAAAPAPAPAAAAPAPAAAAPAPAAAAPAPAAAHRRRLPPRLWSRRRQRLYLPTHPPQT